MKDYQIWKLRRISWKSGIPVIYVFFKNSTFNQNWNRVGKSTVLAAFARASKNIKLAMKTTICKVQGLQASLDLNFIFFPHITYKLKVESIEFIMHSVSGHFRLLKNCHFLINHSSLI